MFLRAQMIIVRCSPIATKKKFIMHDKVGYPVETDAN